MNLSISWINQSEKGRTLLLSKSSVLKNGMRSIGNQAGFVSVATKEELKNFKVGQVIELPDSAKIVAKEFINKDGTSKTVDTWVW